MSETSIKKTAQNLLELADVKINGSRPWDIQVQNEDFYSKVLSGGSLALGESYIDGWWDCQELDQFFARVLGADLDKKIGLSLPVIMNYLRAKFTNRQKKNRAHIVGERHYDAGNDLFQLMLDKRMIYSCGYWKDAQSLDDAQEAKLDLICRKLKLKSGMSVLDIGCGWGGLAKYAAEKYNVKVVGLTISKEQAKLAQDLCAGLPVEIRLQDYRDVVEKFDRIVSIGMFEHVGHKNYKTYMQVANRCLEHGGLFLLHTIGSNEGALKIDPWIEKYIFPNGVVPVYKQISNAAKGIFEIRDWHDSEGLDYDQTLMAWHKNFNSGYGLIKQKYDGQFKRMWNYYLLCCAGSFRVKKNTVWQIVLSKKGPDIAYESVR
ncbi:MAG: cyclopropane fatty acyl phospholipid synthase [Parcubacteria group bacterium]|jgi:cyclopropane-fatty-acyl-phospholipid synthase